MITVPVMSCPKCGSNCKTLSTRTRPDGLKRRRYECSKGHRFSTLSAAKDLRFSSSDEKEKALGEMQHMAERRSAKRHKKMGVASIPAASIFDAALLIKESSDG